MNIEGRHINIWGDSIMKGIVFDETEQKYRVADHPCAQAFSEHTRTDVINHASFGMTSSKATERIARSLAKNPLSQSDIVLLEFGGNDCDFHWSEIAADPDRDHVPNTPIEKFGDTLQAIVSTFTERKISPVIMTLPPLEPNRYFNWISKGLEKANILKWLGDINKIYRWQEAYNEIVQYIAEKNSLRVINIRKAFLVSRNYVDQFCIDGIHPNQQGQNTILDSCLDFVNAL